MTPSDLIGSWTLISCTLFTENAADRYPVGTKPTGLIIYSPDGMMSAFILRDPTVTAEGSALLAYASRWELEGDIVRHHVLFNTEEGRAGQTVLRKVHFEGNRLVLQTERKQGRHGLSWLHLVWRRP